MTLTRLHIVIVLLLAVVVWGVVLLIQGTPISIEHAAPFGIVVGFLGLVALAVEHVLWRQRWLHGWLFCRPDLRGTWLVELQSSYEDPATKIRIPPIVCYMGVTQTFYKLQLHLMTPESESWLIAHSITKSPSEDGYKVFGVYSNQPNVHLRAYRSEIHFGAIVLDTHGPQKLRPATVTGEYFTDRLTKGSLLLSRRIAAQKTRFADADAAFGEDG
ncbi:hypothetical protein [Luteimonas terrae]|uniref:CD-NTase-associated protein 15 domain-containing protein n=1 Tax=Luteimonas terrae TaxID=1530191 RepID=A0A4R5UAE6_9GAMM|nr:hypothetical protein [Luteimonas terrae]TDK31561.1 hypothetical protein E2F49_08930 [Luteimonas terrae]